MLKKGFLGALSDTVMHTASKNEEDFLKIAEGFGMRRFMEKTAKPEETLGLFAEWLVFDSRQKIFGDKTGLEYFLERNPLNLREEALKDYQELLQFEVGLFEVRTVEVGRGIGLWSILRNVEYFVHDINSSLSLQKNMTVWVRISSINGLYHIVGSSLLHMPIKIMPNMQRAMSDWPKEALDAHGIAEWLNSSEPEYETGRHMRDIAKNMNTQNHETAEKKFNSSLQKCGMGNFFTTETYKEWLTNEKKFGNTFAVNALMGLMPHDVSSRDTSTLIDAAMIFANHIPRKKLEGKTPNEVILEKNHAGERVLEMNIHSMDTYTKDLERASALMGEGKFNDSFKLLEQVIKNLLEDRVPYFHAFRAYCNAAMCCFHQDDGCLGEELVDASLRLNPLYDFGIRTYERHILPYYDLSKVPKKDKRATELWQRELKEKALKKYKRTVFAKYEKFLSDISVSLEYQTNTTPTAYRNSKEGERVREIGRNDPCYCNSGKKFNKCCGT